jgi:hypothetical protein
MKETTASLDASARRWQATKGTRPSRRWLAETAKMPRRIGVDHLAEELSGGARIIAVINANASGIAMSRDEQTS